jgi:hypothetical protein
MLSYIEMTEQEIRNFKGQIIVTCVVEECRIDLVAQPNDVADMLINSKQYGFGDKFKFDQVYNIENKAIQLIDY